MAANNINNNKGCTEKILLDNGIFISSVNFKLVIKKKN